MGNLLEPFFYNFFLNMCKTLVPVKGRWWPLKEHLVGIQKALVLILEIFIHRKEILSETLVDFPWWLSFVFGNFTLFIHSLAFTQLEPFSSEIPPFAELSIFM